MSRAESDANRVETGDDVALAPTANQISVREVLAKFDAEFAPKAHAVENGEFALWVGSGILRQAPNLGNMIKHVQATFSRQPGPRR